VRRQQRIHFVALPALDAQALVDTRPDPAEALERHTLSPEVRQALDELSTATRTAVVLCDIDGLTYDEIARSLGVPRGTVRSRIHRGRRHLRSALGDRAPRTVPEDGRP
jgi:RNA polymerase sigma-70 factor (ECF subfamily)